jgi:hypothetical protein
MRARRTYVIVLYPVDAVCRYEYAAYELPTFSVVGVWWQEVLSELPSVRLAVSLPFLPEM